MERKHEESEEREGEFLHDVREIDLSIDQVRLRKQKQHT